MRLRESVKRGYEGEQIIPMQAMKKKSDTTEIQVRCADEITVRKRRRSARRGGGSVRVGREGSQRSNK